MKKCLIWGNGTVFFENFNLIKYHEQCLNIEVVGITSNEKVFSRYETYNFVSKKEILSLDFDVLIIMANGNSYSEIFREAISLGIPEAKIIKYNLLGKQWFDIEKYLTIKTEPPSIFANVCWGGITYNRLNLQFRSPFVNLFLEDDDYLKFLKRPRYYLEQSLVFSEFGYSSVSSMSYPIAKLGDILIHFSHYKTFDEAVECWERRKKRIDWDNIFVMMFTENAEIAKEFSELPYKKKVCFVPFKTDEKDLFYMDFKENFPNMFNWTLVNNMAREIIVYYNPLDLLISGEVIKLNYTN